MQHPSIHSIQACADEENFTAEGGARAFFDSFIEYSVETPSKFTHVHDYQNQTEYNYLYIVDMPKH